MTVKFFTPKEASLRLPFVRKVVADILSKGKQLQAMVAAERPSPALQAEIIELDHQIQKHMNELEAIGCYFKDWNFEIGLVDFPAIINAQEVLLCWRSDEDEIAWFHTNDEGYAGRRPITRELIFS